MKRLILLGLAAGLALVVSPVSAEGPCGIADQLRDARLFDPAVALYAELLKKDPVSPCVVEGLTKLAKARANATADSAFASARALDRQGFHDEAVAALKKAITDNPSADVPPDLVALQVGRPGYIQTYNDWVAPSLGPILLGLGFILAGTLLVTAIVRVLASRERWQFRVNDLASVDAGLGKTLAAAINDAIWRLEADGGGDRLWRGESNAQDFNALTSLATAVPELKAVSVAESLIRTLWPSKTIALSGAVHPPADRLGVGVTLTLIMEGDGRPFAESVTLWEHDFEPWRHQQAEKDASAYYRLINLAAVWTEYALDRYFRGRARNKRLVELATTSWRSYALYASGADWDARSEEERASRQYLRALELDPKNWLAALNLANAESVLADPNADRATYLSTTERVLDRLRAIRPLLPARPQNGPVLDPSRYRVDYLELAVQLERAVILSAPLTGATVTLAVDLARDALTALIHLEKEGLSPKERALRDLLVENEGLILSALAITLARHVPAQIGGPAPSDRAVTLREIAVLHHDQVGGYVLALKPVPRSAYYNLAVYEAHLSQALNEPARLELALGHFKEAAVGQYADFADWSRRDPTLALLRDGRLATRVSTILDACKDLAPYDPVPKAPATRPDPTSHVVELSVKSPVTVRSI